MWFRGCGAAILMLVCLGAKQVDSARMELAQLKAAGASDEKVTEARKAYQSYVSAPSGDEKTFNQFKTAMIDVRQDVTLKRVAFLREARQRLEPRGVSVTDENIAAWSEGKQTASILDDDRWTAASDRIYAAATQVDEKSHVTFRTTKSGATVRYQTLREAQQKKEAKTALQSTNCREDVTPAAYYVWTERQGKTTSRKHEYDIIDPTPTIDLPEDR